MKIILDNLHNTLLHELMLSIDSWITIKHLVDTNKIIKSKHSKRWDEETNKEE
jgi:hypothetical protein